MLAVSVFGDPNMDASFLYSFDGTDNALLQAAGSGNGLVLAFDDAVSASDRKNWKTFLYNICVGVDKKRLDGELRMKRQTRHTMCCCSPQSTRWCSARMMPAFEHVCLR